jgi:transposase
MGEWTRQDVTRLERALRLADGVRTHRRVLAVLRVAQGWSLRQAAEFLGVAAWSVERWVKRYLQSRNPAVLADAPRPGRPRSLDEQAIRQVQRWLRGSPQALGYAAVSWTVPLLREQLRRCGFAVCSEETLRRRLHEANWVWKRPRYVLQRDPEAEEKRAAFSAGSCS